MHLATAAQLGAELPGAELRAVITCDLRLARAAASLGIGVDSPR